MPTRVDPAEFERSRSWLHEIALAVLPAGTGWVEEAHGDRRYDNSGGLVVNIQQNCWYSFGAGIGGYSPIRLLCLLKKEYTSDEAWTWLGAFWRTIKARGRVLQAMPPMMAMVLLMTPAAVPPPTPHASLWRA